MIRVCAEDSPNVRLALDQIAKGEQPTGEILCPGVLSYDEYRKRRATWDAVRQCIGLDGCFYKGAELLLFPPEWLNRSEQLARELRDKHRIARAIGIDTAQGGDNTAMCAGDEQGVMELASGKTPNTAVITGEVIAFGRKHNVDPSCWLFDRGGGGREHADRLRMQGYKGVRTVGFGESVSLEPRRGLHQLTARKEVMEERYAYKNRRAQMYYELSQACDPSTGPGYAIPAEYAELRRQMALIPRETDEEGRLKIRPKQRRDDKDTRETLTEMLGCSPDELDATVLMYHGIMHKPVRTHAGVVT